MIWLLDMSAIQRDDLWYGGIKATKKQQDISETNIHGREKTTKAE